MPSASPVRFGDFRFDPRTGDLVGRGRTTRLAPQLSRLLSVLLDRAGALVEREELRDALWPSDTFVDFDLGLNYCITRLRAALGDDARSARYIETAPKRGYRFIASVHPGERARDPAVAVLPFEDFNRDTGEPCIGDSAVEALIAALAQVSAIRVVSRQSTQHLTGKGPSLLEIGRSMQVDAIVEGSTLCVDTRARVVARLVQIEPERHLWADTHEGELGDLFAFLTDMARTFAGAIAHAMLTARPSRARTDNSGSSTPALTAG